MKLPHSHYYILSEAGRVIPADLLVWAKWFETANRVLEQTEVDAHTTVSTVFLGTNAGLGVTPLLWETLVMGGPLDGEMYRYETRVQAKRGHDEMVAKAKAVVAKPGERQIDLEDE